LQGRCFKQIQHNPDGSVRVGSGMRLDKLVRICARKGWGGLEFLRGIPGTLGGALRMNAGAWGQAIGGRVTALTCMDRSGRIHNLKGNEPGWEYRRAPGLDNLLLLEAV
ncbi:MAG: FAD-binding protein, partial [Kiritimatiellia bacterium]